jgi:hypothetical protein
MVQWLLPGLVILSFVTLAWPMVFAASTETVVVPKTGRERYGGLAALGLALFTAGLLLILPAYTTAGDVMTPGGKTISFGEGHATLAAVNGWRVLLPLLLPVALTAVPTAVSSWPLRRVVAERAAALLIVFLFLSAASVGLLFIPTLVAPLIALPAPPPAAPTT